MKKNTKKIIDKNRGSVPVDNFGSKNSSFDLKDETITVSQLNKLAKTLLENNMPIVWIKGEISGMRTYSHVYFDLKDESSKISCVLFASGLKLLNFKLENGQKIEVRGKVTIYPQNGSYQINVERIRQLGMGELWEAYTRLLNKLHKEGLFDTQYKKPIPIFPKAIGVITSKEGAVIRDVITTLKRRMPNIPIIIYHTAVQGADAAMQITRAIKVANNRNEVDVLIVCRGGGSMEDLWCFNEEVVAREVFASNIPIISAVGHETDTTIIDYVSDLRAPTPTGAAELVAKSRNTWLIELNKLYSQLSNQLFYLINNYKQRIDLYQAKIQFVNPINTVIQKMHLLKLYIIRLKKVILDLFNKHINKLLMLKVRLNNSKLNLKAYHTIINNSLIKLQNEMINLFNKQTNRLVVLKVRLHNSKVNLKPYYAIMNSLLIKLQNEMTSFMKLKSAKLEFTHKNLELLNPSSILSRGYAIVKNSNNKVILSDADVKDQDNLEITLHHGTIHAVVNKS